jgi:hypothetical protein
MILLHKKWVALNVGEIRELDLIEQVGFDECAILTQITNIA